jgi:hypothetical protein
MQGLGIASKKYIILQTKKGGVEAPPMNDLGF